MRNYIVTLLAVAAAAAGMFGRFPGARGAGPAEREAGAKLRILVDKVMQPEAAWKTEEWMVREAADAGFNVYCPRRGHEDLDAVRQVTAWCERYGISHMPWMRGSLPAPEGPEADGRRVLWASGNEQPLWSPNSEELWRWITRYVTAYARISTESPGLVGVFLDFENYAPGKEGNLYSLSYDDFIMRRFARERGLALPELGPGERAEWLDREGLHDEFAAFQVNRWRERCRALRRAVDELNPAFQFCIYPAPGTPFMLDAAYPEWATDRAPLILADASTYGRPSPAALHLRALELNRERLLERRQVPLRAGIPHQYIGGIDPVVAGADPEFCGKNAAMICEVTDGYWVFYEGPRYDRDHPDYFRWFAWANGKIRQGRFEAWREPRQAPDVWSLGALKRLPRELGLIPPKSRGAVTRYEPAWLRGEHVLLVCARAGEPVRVSLQNHPVGHYESPLVWVAQGPDGGNVASGLIPHGHAGVVEFMPAAEGIYRLGATSGPCAFSVHSSNAPIAIWAGERVRFIFKVERLFFNVPAGVERFSITVEGSGAETVRLNVCAPTGERLASAQTSPHGGPAAVQVNAAGRAGQTWSLELVQADEGVLEDSSLRLGAELSPVFFLDPAHVFRRVPVGAR